METLNPSLVLKEARKKAGITQRELAKRAGKAQSVIARIESGATSPTIQTLTHLVDAAGFDLKAELVLRPVQDSHMLDDVNRILQLSPEERLREVKAVSQLITSARRV